MSSGTSDREIRSLLFDPEIPFQKKASLVFRYQFRENPVYRAFVEASGITVPEEPRPEEIPLLPIRAFRETRQSTRREPPPLIFRSSGTSQMTRSLHEVHDPTLYEESVLRGFDLFFPDNPVVWAYAPGYSDNPDSSLIRMMEILIGRDPSGLSRILQEGEIPSPEELTEVEVSGRQLILFGAAFGLLDMMESEGVDLPEGSRVIETGGMKTYRREMSREELHRRLAEGFGLSPTAIGSEYGMCEMLSQAWSLEEGWFESVPWLQVTIRDPLDPQIVLPPGEEGKIGLIDLANLYSCSFILTEDRGVADESGRFQVLGRWNPENLRGCNFMIDGD